MCKTGGVCVDVRTFVPEFGVRTTCRVCVRRRGDGCFVYVYGKASIEKARFPASGEWVNPVRAWASFYKKLYEGHVCKVVVEVEETILHRGLDLLDAFSFERWSRFFVVFLFAMLVINTLTLWNLVASVERSQNEVIKLTRQLQLAGHL